MLSFTVKNEKKAGKKSKKLTVDQKKTKNKNKTKIIQWNFAMKMFSTNCRMRSNFLMTAAYTHPSSYLSLTVFFIKQNGTEKLITNLESLLSTQQLKKTCNFKYSLSTLFPVYQKHFLVVLFFFLYSNLCCWVYHQLTLYILPSPSLTK